MDIIRKMTLRQMKQNKRRTLVTILGVALSVGLVTAVISSVISFADVLKRHYINQDGNWHVYFEEVPEEGVPVIAENARVEQAMVTRELGYARLEGSQNEYKPYWYIMEFDEEALANYPVHVTEGRLPQNTGEILISEHVITNGGVEISVGDTLTLKPGERLSFLGEKLNQNQQFSQNETLKEGEEKTWTVVGLMERFPYGRFEPYSAPGYTAITCMEESAKGEANVGVLLKNPRWNLQEWTAELAGQAGMKTDEYGELNVGYNQSLLEAEWVLLDSGYGQILYGTAFVILLIIALGSASLIRNSFAISLGERSRYLGLLSGVGATRKQKRRSVYFEGFLMGMAGIPAGLLIGILGIGITLRMVSPMFAEFTGLTEELRLCISLPALILTVVIAAVIIWLSAWKPARMASRISPIDAIRQIREIKLTKKQVKTSRLAGRIFGTEGTLALKNMKRNKRKYRTTVLSLTVSMVLFISTGAYTVYIKEAYGMTERGQESEAQEVDGSITFYYFDKESEERSQLESQVTKLLNEDENVSFREEYTVSLMLAFPAEAIAQKAFEVEDFLNVTEEGQVMIDVCLSALSQEDLEKICEDSRISPQAIEEGGYLLFDQCRIHDGSYWYLNLLKDDIPRSLTVKGAQMMSDGQWVTQADKREAAFDLDICARAEDSPWIYGIPVNYPRITLYTNKENLFSMVEKLEAKGKESGTITKRVSIFTKNHDASQIISKVDEYLEAKQMEGIASAADYTKESRNMMNMNHFISVFMYSFIALLTIICLANMFNTISTNMELRRKEFAMLRSMGMTPKGFCKMFFFESLFYGLRTLCFGLPASFAVMFLLLLIFSSSFSMGFIIPWKFVVAAVFGVFAVTGCMMGYFMIWMKKQPIVEVLKEE